MNSYILELCITSKSITFEGKIQANSSEDEFSTHVTDQELVSRSNLRKLFCRSLRNKQHKTIEWKAWGIISKKNKQKWTIVLRKYSTSLTNGEEKRIHFNNH